MWYVVTWRRGRETAIREEAGHRKGKLWTTTYLFRPDRAAQPNSSECYDSKDCTLHEGRTSLGCTTWVADAQISELRNARSPLPFEYFFADMLGIITETSAP